jgi:hypothetical protein
MILCNPSQFFDLLPGFRTVAPVPDKILSYTQSSIQALLTPFFPITAVKMVIGQGLPRRVFSIVEWS